MLISLGASRSYFKFRDSGETTPLFCRIGVGGDAWLVGRRRMKWPANQTVRSDACARLDGAAKISCAKQVKSQMVVSSTTGDEPAQTTAGCAVRRFKVLAF